MKLQIFLEDAGRPVAYYPKLAKFLGSVNSAIFLCQFIYWKGKEKIENEFFKTAEEIEEETGLTYEQQKTARKILKEKGYLTEELKGIPAKIHYSFNWEKISQDWKEFIEKEHKKENCQIAPNKIEGNPQTSMRETHELVQGNPSNYIHRIQHRIHIEYNNNSSDLSNSFSLKGEEHSLTNNQPITEDNTKKESFVPLKENTNNKVICWFCQKLKEKKYCFKTSPEMFLCKNCFLKKRKLIINEKQPKNKEKTLTKEEKLYEIDNIPVFSEKEQSEMVVEVSKEERKEKRKKEKNKEKEEKLDIWNIPF
jgi:hypothetical protein